jgi:hypothetical protein
VKKAFETVDGFETLGLEPSLVVTLLRVSEMYLLPDALNRGVQADRANA